MTAKNFREGKVRHGEKILHIGLILITYILGIDTHFVGSASDFFVVGRRIQVLIINLIRKYLRINPTKNKSRNVMLHK